VISLGPGRHAQIPALLYQIGQPFILALQHPSCDILAILSNQTQPFSLVERPLNFIRLNQPTPCPCGAVN
jgi:hypothetical protein